MLHSPGFARISRRTVAMRKDQSGRIADNIGPEFGMAEFPFRILIGDAPEIVGCHGLTVGG
jgi:hypothetical protein